MTEARICNYERHLGWKAGVGFPPEARDISQLHNALTDSGAHTASYPKHVRAVFSEIKWPRREANHTPSSSAEVKNIGDTHLPTCLFMAWCLIN
jgi:hypothetical protein